MLAVLTVTFVLFLLDSGTCCQVESLGVVPLLLMKPILDTRPVRQAIQMRKMAALTLDFSSSHSAKKLKVYRYRGCSGVQLKDRHVNCR